MYGTTQTVLNDTSGTLTVNKYVNGSSDLRFVRVDDPGGTLCPTTGTLTPDVDSTKATELLASTDRNIALAVLTFFSRNAGGECPDYLYSYSGHSTNNQGEFITGQTACRPPSMGMMSFVQLIDLSLPFSRQY